MAGQWWATCTQQGVCAPWNESPGCDPNHPAAPNGCRNDVSIPMSVGTPVASPVNGLVLSDSSSRGLYSRYGRQPWGGEVDILTWDSSYGYPLQVVNLLHLDTVSVAPYTLVSKGNLIGTSGGQPSGGNWPSDPKYSTGPHLGVGVHAPGAWSANSDPQGLIDRLNAGHDTSMVPTAASLSWGGLSWLPPGSPYYNVPQPNPPPPQPQDCSQYNGFDPRAWICNLQQQFGGLFTWLQQPIRIFKLIGGAGLILIAVVLFVLPTGLEVSGAVTGHPELVATGHAIRLPSATNVGRATKSVSYHREVRRHRAKRAQARSPGAAPSPSRPAPPPVEEHYNASHGEAVRQAEEAARRREGR